ncbi:RebB family R body protein [Dyella acidiphila]|uniref:RebB family R body protein n=1 Tax=Dyella acidiphila TaxID=2775866 RepID=A0ABR9GEN2_9GAMM|nr:RebB family R body protein [Dyella acidiphila]MBE1162511.1 RebB family R body protein [Dyella acidiphila]
MATSPLANSPITDAETDAGIRLPNDAPGTALGNLYQATAHALGIAVENAVNGQQQSNIVLQAATTQAVMLLFTIQTASRAEAMDADKAFAVQPSPVTTAASSAMAGSIEQVLGSANKLEFDGAQSWSHAVGEIMSTAARALWDFQKVSLDTEMAVVKQSAMTAVLIQMIKSPDQLEQYEKILGLIKEL